ncbi:hypothetical protein DSO57_1016619 [Entomophthora muscae]|uniref:Uncharacterized protein n=1 Tax=Entomophthora muscae TaxID=34485 RepID=A0ACC2T5M3_9FUNG|nr:hypothetical protein DSO57_1016619 [Entomophthora muscae]
MFAFTVVSWILLLIPIITLSVVNHISLLDALYAKVPTEANLPYDVMRVLEYLCLMILAVSTVSFIIGIFPRVILWAIGKVASGKKELVKHYLEFYTALTTTMRMVISVVSLFALWCVTFPESIFWNKNENSVGWQVLGSRITFCILITSLIISVEKLLLQVIAVRFHRTAYKQRIEESQYATYVLDTLNKARKKAAYKSNGQSSESYPAGEKRDSISQPTLSSKAETLAAAYQKGDINIKGRIDEEDLHSQSEAKRLAKKIFSGLQGRRRFLLVEDFQQIFITENEAQKAFSFFDKDQNGDISRREMRERISQVYRERKDLNLALNDTSQAVGKLDGILLTLFVLVSAFSCSLVFGNDLYASLIPFGTFFLGLSFIFADSAKELFQSIVFLFIMHPYDAGDRCYIEKENLMVQKVGLLGTRFIHTNGQQTYIPHSILKTKIIYNIRRSEAQTDDIYFEIDFETPRDKFEALRERINKYIEEEESREIFSDPIVGIAEIISGSNKLKVYVSLNHKSNWQEGRRRWARKTRFMLALKEICIDLGIKFTPLTQKVEILDSSPLAPMPPHC